MRSSLSWCLFPLLLASLPANSAAQSSLADSAKIPNDPGAALLLAAQSDNLTAGGVKPWHVKASFRLLDEQGITADEGIYEEFWAGPNKFKRTFSGKGYTQTDTSATAGVMRSGQREDMSRLLLNMRRDLVNPLPDARSVGNGPFSEKQIDSAGTTLRCIFLRDPAGVPAFCISVDQPVLRLSSWPGDGIQILHNRILRFQGLYVPGDLVIVRAGKTILSAHLESIDILDPVNDADFAATSDAAFVPMRVSISAGVAAGMIEHKVSPEYPPEAQGKGISGTVVLEAVIGVDGRIKDLKVISGPQVFQKPAVDAVRTWRYRPYLLNGVPVEVRTTINLVFSLGG